MISNPKPQTLHKLRYDAALFCRMQKLSEVCGLLKTPVQKLKSLASAPEYHTFTVPKGQEGMDRQIENPVNNLKNLQKRLNHYLQAVYYMEKTPVSYGFVTNALEEADRRDILSHAHRHLGKPYLLNMDLADFFHSITRKQVMSIWQQSPMRLHPEVGALLSDLVTYEGRLPVGAPTSPALSNLVARPLDRDLMQFAEAHGLTITRYADDISVSSDIPISDLVELRIREIASYHGFQINATKTRYFGPESEKTVTGLLLREGKVTLPDDYIPSLEHEIHQLKEVMDIQNRQGMIHTQWVEAFKRHLTGRIAFVGYVKGNDSTEKTALTAAFDEAAYPPPEDFGSYSWRVFHYPTAS